MECHRNLIRFLSLSGNLLKKRLSSYLNDSAHIMPVKSMEYLKFLSFSFGFKCNHIAEMICLGRVPLLDNYLDYVFALEYLVGDNWNINY